jgi:hypothetical protein
MSKHIGTVHAFERNTSGPHIDVSASLSGVEIVAFTSLQKTDVAYVVLSPSDARTLVALLSRAIDETERMRAKRDAGECCRADLGGLCRHSLLPKDP